MGLTWLWASFACIIGFSTVTALIRSMNEKQYRLIESYTDATANPCTDFFQYACGNWQAAHESENFTDSFDNMYYDINKDYQSTLLTRKQDLRKQHRFVRQVLAYYKSCKAVDDFDPREYFRILEREEGIKWPQHSRGAYRFFRNFKRQYNSSSSNANRYWLKLLAILRKYGLNGIFISENIYLRQNDSSKYLIDIDRPVLNEEFLTLESLVGDTSEEDDEKYNAMKELFGEFETKLLELYDIPDRLGYEELSLDEINIPELKPYLETVLNTTQIDAETKIGITNRPYLKALFQLLRHYDDEFLAIYLKVRLVFFLVSDTSAEFTTKGCIKILRNNLPFAMAWLYEQMHPELMSQAGEMQHIFDQLRAHFGQVLNSNPNNFDNEIIEFLNAKLKHMKLKVGISPSNSTAGTIDSYYRNLTLNENSFCQNHLQILRFVTNKQHARLGSTLEPDAHNFYFLEDSDSGLALTPYYLPRHNLVILPLTMLHLPFYHPQFHDIFKFSLMGFLLAHEITHSFDESGVYYDENGTERSHYAKLFKDNKVFGGHLECLESKNPQGLDEKIADVSGLRWAYETYFGNGTAMEQQLPWSKITPQQLFFRNFALFSCGDISKEDEDADITHGTLRSRLYDAVNQFDEFGRAFNCYEGASMNPRRKCQLWRR